MNKIATTSKVEIVIPARLASTRLKEKALADVHGKPMVVRVAELAAKASNVARIVVATDSQKIADVVSANDIETVMTPAELASGTDRVAFVAKNLSEEIIVNVQ